MTIPRFSPYGHLFMTTPELPPMPSPLTYVVAGNGLFLWAKRVGLEVLIPLVPLTIQGLESVEPFVRLDAPKVSAHQIEHILTLGAGAQRRDGVPVEMLFFLSLNAGTWHLDVPPQFQTPSTVQPVLQEMRDHVAYNHVLLEVHTHPRMPAFFSNTDDRDERGFRIYAVLGDPHLERDLGKIVAQLCMRVVVYDPVAASYEFPASWVMEVPDGITECFSSERFLHSTQEDSPHA